MSQFNLIPEAEYKLIVDRDTARARRVYDFTMSSDDKNLMFREGYLRPILHIKDMFETSTELYGDRPAFWEKPSHKEPYKVYSYKDALARVHAIGTALINRGFHDKAVSVLGDNSYAWATAYLTVTSGVGLVVPLDKELTTDEIEHLLIIADVEAVFYPKKNAAMLEEIHSRGNTKLKLYINQNAAPGELKDYEVSVDTLIFEGQGLLKDGNRDFLDAQINAEKPAILIFTAGTTGVAKGVVLNQRNIATELMIPDTVIGIVPEDKFFSFLPLHHTYECTCGFLVPLTQGASIAYCEGLRHIVDNLAEAKPTVFLGVPLIFENLYNKIWQNARKSGKDKLLKNIIKVNKVTKKVHIDLGNAFFKDIRAVFGGRMRILICGGAAIDPAVIDGLKAFGIATLQGYGLTECGPICALNPIKGGKSASAGYLIPGFEGKIVDADPETGIGEICARGENVMMGYFNDPEATAEVMEDGWYHTGDYGYIDKDNFIFITGRKKNVIITKTGKNVFPEELEYKLGLEGIFGDMMVWEKPSDKQNDALIVATLRVNEERLAELLGEDYTQEEADKRVWEAVNKVNEELPIYKRIRRIYVREDAFDVTTKKSIRRFVEENREGREI